MADIFEYLSWRGDLTLDKAPLNEVDGIILARFAYMPFEHANHLLLKGNATINEVCRFILKVPDIENHVLIRDDVQLLKTLMQSARFRNMKVYDYINRFDAETETQFSAITLTVSDEMRFISFRGTDSTLVGWKEDFNMCFVSPVPSQLLAVSYLNDAASRYSGSFIIGGHSKGGNLAVYSAAFCAPEVLRRIHAVYNYDGPGFNENLLKSESLANICGIINTFVPQSSVVGMLFGRAEDYKIVHSTATGVFQHDIYSWQAQRDSLVYLETVTGSSKFIDSALNEWVSDMDLSQRESFVDAVFTILTQTNASTLKELSENWFISARLVLKSIKNLDDTTRRAVNESLRLLMKCAKNIAVQSIHKNKQQKISTQEQ